MAESIFVVLLGLLLLLLKEFKLAFPEGLFLLKLALKVSMLSLHLVVLGLPVLNLLSDTKLPLRECLVELFILLLELKVLDLVALNELLLLSLQVLVFLELHSSFPLSLRL